MQSNLGTTKDLILDAKNQMAQTLALQTSPRGFLRHHSEMMDDLVRKAFQKAQSEVSAPSVCLIAVGGYGRGELAPYSDIDLLLLYTSPQREKFPSQQNPGPSPGWPVILRLT